MNKPNKKPKVARPVESPAQAQIQITESAEEFVAWAEEQPASYHLSIEEGQELLRQMSLQRQKDSGDSASNLSKP